MGFGYFGGGFPGDGDESSWWDKDDDDSEKNPNSDCPRCGTSLSHSVWVTCDRCPECDGDLAPF